MFRQTLRSYLLKQTLRPYLLKQLRLIHSRPTAEDFSELLRANNALGKAASTLNLGDAAIAGEQYLRTASIRERVLAEIEISRGINDELVKIIYDEPADYAKLKKLSADFKPIPWSIGDKIFIGVFGTLAVSFTGIFATLIFTMP